MAAEIAMRKVGITELKDSRQSESFSLLCYFTIITVTERTQLHFLLVVHYVTSLVMMVESTSMKYRHQTSSST